MAAITSLLWLIFLNVITKNGVEPFLFNGHSNVSESLPDNGFYNIYSKLDYLERALQNLQTSVQQKESHMDTLLRHVLLTINEMDSKIESSGLQNMSLEIDQLKESGKHHGSAVGFTTKLSGTYNIPFSIIQGHSILYNGGNAYNGTVFTCPCPGLYLFHVSMMTSSTDSGIWIYKNSQHLTLAYAGHDDSQRNGASASAAVWLDVGDQVYLRRAYSNLTLAHNSAFTGVKVN